MLVEIDELIWVNLSVRRTSGPRQMKYFWGHRLPRWVIRVILTVCPWLPVFRREPTWRAGSQGGLASAQSAIFLWCGKTTRRADSTFRRRANHLYKLAHPVPLGGAFRERHGRRGGMRWTLRRARRAMPKRTAKSCGPDASTLVSSRWK